MGALADRGFARAAAAGLASVAALAAAGVLIDGGVGDDDASTGPTRRQHGATRPFSRKAAPNRFKTRGKLNSKQGRKPLLRCRIPESFELL